MRRHAQAESVGSTSGSRSGFLFAVVLSLLFWGLALAIGVSGASAGKGGVATIGGPATGTEGGLFNNPRGVAINQSGAGGVPAGTIYVAD